MALTEKDLIYAAYTRCPCGAGLAYQRKCGPQGFWDCSAILLETAIPSGQPGSVTHTDRLPFVFYEIKSEGQPSANGATTRPGPPIDRKVQKMDDLRIYAEEWLTQMQRACLDTGVSFTIPSRKEEQQGVITLEWMRSFPPGRTLTILIDEHGAEYVRSDITGQVGVGKVADTDIFLLLWHWLAL